MLQMYLQVVLQDGEPLQTPASASMTQPMFPSQIRHSIERFLPFIALALLTSLLWLPFGFNIGYTGDDWYLDLYARHNPSFMLPARPLVALSSNIGYLLSPGHFFGFNFMLFLVFLLRGWLTFAILRETGIYRGLSFAVAALTIFFPADNGTYYMGGLPGYYSSVCFLGALYALLRYWQRPTLRTLIFIWILQILSLGMYEASYPLIVVSPIMLLAFPPRSRIRWIKMLRGWYFIPILNALRYVVILMLKPEALRYQSSIIASPSSIDELVISVANIYKRHFWDAWVTSDFGENHTYLAYAVVAGVIVAVVCWWLLKDRTALRPILTRRAIPRETLVLLIGGLAVIGISISFFLPTAARDDHMRTYFISAIGAALVIVTALGILARRPLIFAILIGALGGLGCLRLLEQGLAYDQHSEEQQQLLLQTLEVIPSVPPNTGLVIMDEAADGRWEQVFHTNWSMQNPFIVTYQQILLVVAVCSPDSQIIMNTTCHEESNQFRVTPNDNPEWALPYPQLIFLRYQPDGTLSLIEALPDHPDYNPYALFDPDSAPAADAYVMFGEPVPGGDSR